MSQGGPVRTFDYDSLSLLESADNPESGLIEYDYDNNGNVTERSDERNFTASYGYDALNRVTSNSYDALHRIQQVTDALSNPVGYQYDARDISSVAVRLGFVERIFVVRDIFGIRALGPVLLVIIGRVIHLLCLHEHHRAYNSCGYADTHSETTAYQQRAAFWHKGRYLSLPLRVSALPRIELLLIALF